MVTKEKIIKLRKAIADNTVFRDYVKETNFTYLYYIGILNCARNLNKKDNTL